MQGFESKPERRSDEGFVQFQICADALAKLIYMTKTLIKLPTKAMQILTKAIATLGISTALGGLTLIFHATPALSNCGHSSTNTHQQHHHSSQPDVPLDKNKTPRLTPKQRTAERFINKALDKLHKQEYKAAVVDFNEAIQFAPEHFLAYVHRGDLRRQLGDNRGAIADYTKAICNNPTFSYIYVNRGIARENLADYKGAIEDYTQASELYPEDGIGYSLRGAVRSKLGDNRGAIEDLNTAIGINPGRADAYLKRGNVYIKLGNSQVALADYQKAARLFSEQGNVAGYLKVKNLMTVHSLQTRG